MRTIREIIRAARCGETVRHEEAQYCMLALALERENTLKQLSACLSDVAVDWRLAVTKLVANKYSFGATDAKIALGPENDPADEAVLKRYRQEQQNSAETNLMLKQLSEDCWIEELPAQPGKPFCVRIRNVKTSLLHCVSAVGTAFSTIESRSGSRVAEIRVGPFLSKRTWDAYVERQPTEWTVVNMLGGLHIENLAIWGASIKAVYGLEDGEVLLFSEKLA